MEVINEIIGGITELLSQTFGFSIKFINVLFWAMAGALILPCVFVAGNIYPMWEKWAEKIKK